MKKAVYLILIVFVLLFVGVLPVCADGHGHGGHGHGHSFFSGNVWIGPGWGGWGPWWWGAPYYPNYPYYSYNPYPYYAPQQSSEYVEQTPQVEEQTYWYFCPNARNYYPYVKRCPGGWLKVIPSSAPPDGSE